MTTFSFFSAFLLLIPAGIFGAFLPVVRELGRPTRLASALLCGAVAIGAEALIASIAGISPSLPLLLGPLAIASAIAGWYLCRLPESPGPENAYPGFSGVLIVALSTVYLVAVLATSEASSVHVAVRGAGWLHLIADLVGDAAHFLPAHLPGAATFGTALWLLAGLPLVAALLAMQLPLRRSWMIGAYWYAASSMSIAIWNRGASAGAALIVFATLSALALAGSAKERRLLPFAAVMLVGTALTGFEGFVAVVAIVGGAFVRDLDRGARPASRQAVLLVAGPVVAMGLRLGAGLAQLDGEPGAALSRAFPAILVFGIFVLACAIALPVIVAVMGSDRGRVAPLLPLLAPVVALSLLFALGGLHGTGSEPWSGVDSPGRLAQTAISMLILTIGLSRRRASSHRAHPPQRPVHAR